MAAAAADDADGTRIKSRSDFLSSGRRDGAAAEEDEEDEEVENGDEKGAEAVRRASAGRCGWQDSAAPRRSKHAAMRQVRGLDFLRFFVFKFYRFLRASHSN